jgi:hypothetical protein
MGHCKDSGERVEYASGAVRDPSRGKGRYDLLPMHAIYRLAVAFENGCEKYPDRNWERGEPCSRFVDSALRHLSQYLAGDDDEDHFAQALWNVACGIQTEQWAIEGKVPANVLDLPRHAALREQIECDSVQQCQSHSVDSQEPGKSSPPVAVKIGRWKTNSGKVRSIAGYYSGSGWPWVSTEGLTYTRDGQFGDDPSHPENLVEYLGPLED